MASSQLLIIMTLGGGYCCYQPHLKHFYLFYFWLHWVFVAARGLSLVAGVGPLFAAVNGFSFGWPLLLRSTVSRVQAQELWGMGLVALRTVESSWSRDQTHVPLHCRRVLYHWLSGKYYQPHFIKNKTRAREVKRPAQGHIAQSVLTAWSNCLAQPALLHQPAMGLFSKLSHLISK